MKGLLLVAITKKGELAIRQAVDDGRNAPLVQRKAYDALYLQTVVSHDPYTLRIEHRQEKFEEVIPPQSMFPPIQKALTANGATKDIDYQVVFDG
jgi:hypothetical protein